MSDPILVTLPLSAISAREGFNPRKSYRQAPMEQLVESIRQQDLIQPIVVRPRTDGEDGYWITAGHRRYLAMQSLGRETIPALVREGFSEEDAKLASIVENLHRADLSPAEEALAARDVLDLCQNDRAAAAKQLGWSATKLESRLLLLHASAAVLQAVADGTILVAHSELLAGLPHDLQDKALARIIERKTSVQELREQVKGVVIPLSLAIFDVAGCKGCPFNTETQGSLFGDAVAGTNCKHRQCFTDKTTVAIEAKRAALAEDVATVALTSEKDPSTYTALTVAAVGAEQFEQCKGCQHFGAVIHSTLDGRTGRVERPVCFNMSCHSAKVALQTEAAAGAQQPAATDTVAPIETVGPASGKKSKPTTKAAAKTARSAAPASISSAVMRVMLPAYQAAAAEAIANDPMSPLALATVSLQSILSEAGITLPGVEPTGGKSPEARLIAVLKREPAAILAGFRAAVEALVRGQSKNSQFSRNGFFPPILAVTLAQSKGIDMAPHFKVTEKFLEAHTREGITSLLDESGFKDWMLGKPDGDKTFRALLALKKAELPAAVMAHGFDWNGFVPKSVTTATATAFKGL